jgi:hypothetical protein
MHFYFLECPGVNLLMPPELMELYMLYQQELEARTDNENKIISDANVMIRVRAHSTAEADS